MYKKEPETPPTIEPRKFRVNNMRNRKVCNWCSSRVLSGVTIWRGGLVRGFVCHGCAKLVYQVSTGRKQVKKHEPEQP